MKKYIYVVSDILDIRQTPTARFFVAERIPCDADILQYLNNSSRAGKVLHAYLCQSWTEAKNRAEAANRANG